MMEEIQKIGWERLAVGFIYLCVQFLVFASLMLTTTSMPLHVILIFLVILFYFMTVFKEVSLTQCSPEPMSESINQTTKTLSAAGPELRTPRNKGPRGSQLPV